MGAWDDYRSCCRAAAADDRAATFCPDCGHPLLRCPASDCRALLAPLGHCPSCVDLRLSLEKGAILEAKSGECLSVPLAVMNNSPVRALSVKCVLRDGTNLQQAAVPIAWEQLEARRTRALAVEAGPFPHGGIFGVRLTAIVAADFGDVEETYAFSGKILVDVEGPPPANVTYDNRGWGSGQNALVYARDGVAGLSQADRQASALKARTDIPLERAERFELQQGHRGYERAAVRVPRNVEFQYAGFPSADRPPDGPWLQGPTLRCGRSGRARDAGPEAQPNDLCLRVYDPASGELDREASTAISRRACDLLLQNDRLHLRVVSGSGLSLNGERLDAGAVRVVGDGDLVTVPAGRGRTLTLAARFRASAGLVTHVRLEKATQ